MSMFAGVQHSAENGASVFVDGQYPAGNGTSMFVDVQYSQGCGASMFIDAHYSEEDGAPTFIDAHYSTADGAPAFSDTQHSQVNGAPMNVDAPFRFDHINEKMFQKSTSIEDATKLYLGHDNTLYYLSSKMTIGSFRAYFQLLGGLTAGEPKNGKQGIRAFELNLGEETGIHSISEDSVYPEYSERSEYAVTWYSLDGYKLMQKPTQKGMYIGGDRKVMIK